jgi:hypothetical protein
MNINDETTMASIMQDIRNMTAVEIMIVVAFGGIAAVIVGLHIMAAIDVVLMLGGVMWDAVVAIIT